MAPQRSSYVEEEPILESNSVLLIGKQLRAATAAERKQLMIGIKESYTAIGRKVATVMQLAVAWANACEGQSLSAQVPLASVLGTHLTRLLTPGAGSGSTKVIEALLTSNELQHNMPSALSSPALLGVLASLARRFTDGRSRGVLDHILTTANMWGHLPVAAPHILQRQADFKDHFKSAVATCAASLASNPRVPPASTAYSLPLGAPEVRLHLPVLTAVMTVFITHAVHRRLLDDLPPAAVRPAADLPALALMERLAHVLAGDEAACSSAKRLSVPPLHAVVPGGAYQEKRRVSMGSEATPLALLQAFLLQDAGHSAADWPCGESWDAAAQWVLTAQEQLLLAEGPPDQAPPPSTGVNAPPSAAEIMSELRQGAVALGVCSDESAELHVSAALTAAAAVKLRKVSATALILFPPPALASRETSSVKNTSAAHAEASAEWLCKDSGLQVAAAVRASPLAAAVFLHGTRNCLLLPEVAQSQQWLDRVHALLRFLPCVAEWHASLHWAVCDLVCALVAHLSPSRSSSTWAAEEEDSGKRALLTGADDSDSRPLGAVVVSAQRTLLSLCAVPGGLDSVTSHLCLPAWGRSKEFAMVCIRNILRDFEPRLQGGTLRRLLAALAVSRGSGGDSTWGPLFAQTYPHSMATLYQVAVSSTSSAVQAAAQHSTERGADGREAGDTPLWQAGGILSHGTTPWAHARQLWDALCVIISPCVAVE